MEGDSKLILLIRWEITLAEKNVELVAIATLTTIIWAALHKKVPNVLSRCHTKRRTGARGRAPPSFGMTPTF